MKEKKKIKIILNFIRTNIFLLQFQKIINDSLCTNNTLCNKKLLKYKGYCLIYNKNDYLTIKINFK